MKKKGGSGTRVDSGSTLQACGLKFCKSDEYCCNESCGICIPVGWDKRVCDLQPCQLYKEQCDVKECGPSTKLDQYRCPDGGYTGPVCVREADGTCHWMVAQCPSTHTINGCEACSDFEYCEVLNCGRNGERGTCAARPTNCATMTDFMPVCACDGRTYFHPCYPNMAGFAVDDSGECQCAYGFADCDGNPTNGCETDINNSRNCGSCGTSCQGSACIGGVCSSEKLNCGGPAGIRCPTDQYCNYSVVYTSY